MRNLNKCTFFLLLIPLAGCGGAQDETLVNVKGKIIVNSKSLQRGCIVFKVRDSTFASSIGKGGAYSISVPVGEAKVWLQESTTDDPGSVENPFAKPKKLPVSAKYMNESSGLTYTVTSERIQTKDFRIPS